MERPKKYGIFDLDHTMSVYMDYHIDPLLDELERLKADKKPFPSPEEFRRFLDRFEYDNIDMEEVYNYFAQFQYERVVFPKVGQKYEFSLDGKEWDIDIFQGYEGTRNRLIPFIRPVTSPTREEILAKLTDEELAVLGVER